MNDQNSRGTKDPPEVMQSNRSWKGLSTSGITHDKSDRALSPIERVEPEEVKPVEVAEIEIQSAFEKNLSDLEDRPEHVHSLIKTPVGAIEVHAIDPKKRPANVEFKKPDGLE